jgi:hypothetical protein
MVRVYGANRAAGVRIEEQEGNRSIEPGALGYAGYPGIFEKGPVNQLQIVSSRSLFDRIYGGIISDSLAPDAAQDFYSLANGAGGLALVRVTDGNERVASLALYTRIASLLTPLGRLDAKNGGRWGGKAKLFTKSTDTEAAIQNATLQIGASNANDFKTNELKGGFIELDGVPSKRYPITGNTSTGLISVAADQTMRADLITATADPPTNLRFYVTLENEGKQLAVQINDGEENKDTEFSMEIFSNGLSVNKYGNLSTDPASARYWVNIINNDGNNYEVTAVDTFTGAYVATSRPANQYLKVLSVSANIVTCTIHDFTISSPGGGNPTLALGTTTDADVKQKITITMTSATVGTAVSDRFGALGTVTLGTLFDPHNAAGGAIKNKWVPPFTVTAGASPLVATNVLTINYKPLPVGGLLAGAAVYPDKVNEPRDTYRVVSNTHKAITFQTGTDFTAITATNNDLMVVAPYQMENGADGNAGVVDASYTAAWDVSTSPFNRVRGKNLGLIKFGTPGVTSTAVQKAGLAYAEAKNHQYRYEIPANITGDTQAITYVNDTLGRSDYAKVSHPSYGSVPDPDPAAQREGKLKVISLIGMIHGREARIAADFQGYHKAAAGQDAILPRLLSTALGDRDLDEENLNPSGIGVIKKVNGNYVLWGDRTPCRDTAFKFAHKRELLSYYEQVMIEAFNFIIFSINDASSDADARTAIVEFFTPEFVKRAIRGDSLIGGQNPAMILKVDAELNTDATRAAGNKIASIALRLADTTERFIIRIGQQGVFEGAN